MRYAGGKDRIAAQLVEAMLKQRQPQHDTYIEPFCGGANVLWHMAPHFPKVIGSDIQPDLILMWQALQQGWEPPVEGVDEKEHDRLSLAEPSAERGYAGFACSFRGVWFGGYADEAQRRASYNVVRKQIATMKHVRFMRADYRSLTQVSPRCLIYCDPPYAGTSGYKAGARHFDSNEFWPHVYAWAAQGATVLVSEYRGPAEAEVVWSGAKSMSLSASVAARKTVIEKLFMMKP